MNYSLTAKHIVVKGEVQGVFFRKTAKQVAEALNITGWVKNTEEGNVEIFAQASEDKIAQLTEWCKQGPPRAEVEDVEVKDAKPDQNIKQFSIAY
ncbi:MAG TPA: acylphosphatase [Parafilimonas sp.]|nr:acylphosphatase [Parafilimonas sp.]